MIVSKPEIHEKKWGKEFWIANNDLYCGKILELKRGWRCSIHYHKKKHETFFILDGTILMEFNNEKRVMKPGDILEVKQLSKHRFTGIIDSKIIEFSTHHEEEDSYRDVESGKVPENEFIELVKNTVNSSD